MKRSEKNYKGKTYIFLLEDQDSDWLDKLAERDGVSRSAALRLLLRASKRAHERAVDFAE